QGAPGATSPHPAPSGPATGSEASTGSAAVAPDGAVLAAGQAPPDAQAGGALGLDACSVPSIATMTACLASPYRVIGTYLGGMNWACGYGNFSASWVSHTAAQGWRLAPLWVGRQASCSTISGVARINVSDAAAGGEAEARTAVVAAKKFG